MGRRPGSAAAAALFPVQDVATWRRALASYDSCIRAKQGTSPTQRHLSKDDLYLSGTVAANMRAAKKMTHAEMSRVMRWKLARGKWRPLQKAFDENNSPAAVEACTGVACKALDAGQWKKALKKVAGLHAVGPATASAVLALYAPAMAPFMGDEAMEAVPGSLPCTGNSSAYTEDAYFDFRDALVGRASELESLGWTGCTAEAVGRALWAAAMLSIGKGKKVSKNFQLPPLPAAAAGTAAQEDAAEAAAAGCTDEPSKDGGPTKKRRKTLVG